MLCEYAGNEICVSVSDVIADNIDKMTPDVIAAQCSDILADKMTQRMSEDDVDYTDVKQREQAGFSPEQIHQHITKHMLNANVMLANQARQLLGLNNVLYRNIMSSATEEGIIDSKQVKDWLTVSSQLTSLYKSGDPSKMLFSKSVAQQP